MMFKKIICFILCHKYCNKIMKNLNTTQSLPFTVECERCKKTIHIADIFKIKTKKTNETLEQVLLQKLTIKCGICHEKAIYEYTHSDCKYIVHCSRCKLYDYFDRCERDDIIHYKKKDNSKYYIETLEQV